MSVVLLPYRSSESVPADFRYTLTRLSVILIHDGGTVSVAGLSDKQRHVDRSHLFFLLAFCC